MLALHLLLQVATLTTTTPSSPPSSWRALIVGGGPTPAMNQAAIETHVRYVDELLPESVDRRILFTDGRRATPTVQFRTRNGRLAYRAPTLERIDGPSTAFGVDAAFSSLVASRPEDPLMLYFAGHGERNPRNQ